MAEINAKANVEVKATFTFNENELHALNALHRYGAQGFIGLFEKHLGNLDPSERAGLTSFYESIRRDVPPILAQAESARAVFFNQKIAVDHKKSA